MSKLTMIAKKLEDVLKQLPEKFAQLDKLANDSGKIKEKSELIYNKFLVAHNMERAKEWMVMIILVCYIILWCSVWGENEIRIIKYK